MRLRSDDPNHELAASLIKDEMHTVEYLITFFHDLWISPIEVCLGIYILSSIIGHATILLLVTVAGKNNFFQ